jgi:diaminopimelate epimerase
VARVRFSKYEGLGNDFVVIETPDEGMDFATVQALCDRHFGIGADGVLLVSRGAGDAARPRMVVLNADGSRPEMCGNGLRCVARHLARQRGLAEGELVIETDVGPLGCVVRGPEIEVDMGRLTEAGPVEIPLDGKLHRFVRMSIGNPHAITFEPYEHAEIDRVGPYVEKASPFPEGTNVEFARLGGDGGIDLVVWERGVGRTLACGTGACATVAAACLAGTVPFDAFTPVRLPGGKLEVRVTRESMRATLRGPARNVFDGEVDIP